MAESGAEIEHALAGTDSRCLEKQTGRRLNQTRLTIQSGQFLRIAAEHVRLFA